MVFSSQGWTCKAILSVRASSKQRMLAMLTLQPNLIVHHKKERTTSKPLKAPRGYFYMWMCHSRKYPYSFHSCRVCFDVHTSHIPFKFPVLNHSFLLKCSLLKPPRSLALLLPKFGGECLGIFWDTVSSNSYAIYILWLMILETYYCVLHKINLVILCWWQIYVTS